MSAYGISQRKVAIPRIPRPEKAQNTIRLRVSRACTACQSQKTKCTGGKPRCERCKAAKQDCIYILPKKDKLKIATEKCQRMATLLRSMRSYATAQDAAAITELLENDDRRQSDTPHNPSTPLSNPDTNDPTTSDPYADIEHERLSSLDENLHADDRVRTIGFFGMSSEVRWLHMIAAMQPQRARDPPDSSWRTGAHMPYEEQASMFYYCSDARSVSAADLNIDPHELPPFRLAEKLLSCYMANVHDSFPILSRRILEDQFRKYYTARERGNPPRLSVKWLANLNLVFAIGAKYLCLVGDGEVVDEHAHLMFRTRAKALYLDSSHAAGPADVPQIQGFALLTLYCLCVGQVNRAWGLIGIALRSAHALGLHLRNEDASATTVKQERLVRLWWSLHSLEHMLSVIVGRPSMISHLHCSVPLPFPKAEDHIANEPEDVYRTYRRSTNTTSTPQDTDPTSPCDLPHLPNTNFPEANSGSYFKATVQICTIAQAITTTLYSATTPLLPPSEKHEAITRLQHRLDSWLLSLPAHLNFQHPSHATTPAFTRERTLLGFQLCSAQILLSRPYLHMHAHTTPPHNFEGPPPPIIHTHDLMSPLAAAKAILDFLPDNAHPAYLFERGPWWCIVHHLMQAGAVFMLGLVQEREGLTRSREGLAQSRGVLQPHDREVLYGRDRTAFQTEQEVLVRYMRKTIRCLQCMNDGVAQRAAGVLMGLFDGAAGWGRPLGAFA